MSNPPDRPKPASPVRLLNSCLLVERATGRVLAFKIVTEVLAFQRDPGTEAARDEASVSTPPTA